MDDEKNCRDDAKKLKNTFMDFVLSYLFKEMAKCCLFFAINQMNMVCYFLKLQQCYMDTYASNQAYD